MRLLLRVVAGWQRGIAFLPAFERDDRGIDATHQGAEIECTSVIAIGWYAARHHPQSIFQLVVAAAFTAIADDQFLHRAQALQIDLPGRQQHGPRRDRMARGIGAQSAERQARGLPMGMRCKGRVKRDPGTARQRCAQRLIEILPAPVVTPDLRARRVQQFTLPFGQVGILQRLSRCRVAGIGLREFAEQIAQALAVGPQARAIDYQRMVGNVESG